MEFHWIMWTWRHLPATILLICMTCCARIWFNCKRCSRCFFSALNWLGGSAISWTNRKKAIEWCLRMKNKILDNSYISWHWWRSFWQHLLNCFDLLLTLSFFLRRQLRRLFRYVSLRNENLTWRTEQSVYRIFGNLLARSQSWTYNIRCIYARS